MKSHTVQHSCNTYTYCLTNNKTLKCKSTIILLSTLSKFDSTVARVEITCCSQRHDICQIMTDAFPGIDTD